jgi:hypothetical protein
LDSKSLLRRVFGPTEVELKPGSNSGSKTWLSDAQLREGTLSLLDSILDFGPEKRKLTEET